MQYFEDMVYKGMNVEVYLSSFMQEAKNNSYKLLIRKDTRAPVLLHFIGYDRLFGSHYDEYIVMYDTFTVGVKDESVFDLEQSKCMLASSSGFRLPLKPHHFCIHKFSISCRL